MVKDPSEYSWSSYRFNALGEKNELITPHATYQTLGKNPKGCRLSYQALFLRHIPEAVIGEIRAATNKAWVLGDDRFKAKVERLIARQVRPKSRGGDRRSELFKKIDDSNRV